MNDPHDFDELASAHLDGVTSPEEAAMVDADPALQARVEELRAVRAALGEVPAADPTRRDAAIAAALAAFEEDETEQDIAAPVVPLAPRRRLSPTTVRVLSAAAVVAILALLVPLLAGIDDGGDDEAATTFESSDDASESAGDVSRDTDAQVETAPQASPTTPLAEALVDQDLGTYPDVDALADAVANSQPDSGDFSQRTQRNESAAQLCGPSPPTGTRVGTAVVDGEQVVVWLGVSPEGRSVLTVLRIDGCAVIEEREL